MSATWDDGSAWKSAGFRFFRGLRVRIVASVALVAGGFVFVLLYLAFLAQRFSWYQNLAVVGSALVIVPAGLVVIWVLWGLSMVRRGFDWEH